MPVIKIRRGTTTQWAASTRVLQLGELGLDTTLNKLKAGNGTAIWSNLPFLQADVDITELSQDAVAAALAAGTHSNITVTYSDNDNSISLATGPDVVTTTSLSNTLTDPSSGYVSVGDVGVADGVASLGPDGKIPDSEIPDTIARDSEIITSYNSLTDKPTIPSLTGYATESYVTTAISNLVDAAPTTLNTLNELAAALGDDANYATTISTALGTKAPTASPTFTNKITVNGTATSYLEAKHDGHTGSIDLQNTGIYLSTVSDDNLYSGSISAEQQVLIFGTNHGEIYYDDFGFQIGMNGGDSVNRLKITGDVYDPLTVNGNTTTFEGTVNFGSSTINNLSYSSLSIPVYNTVADLPSAASNHGRWAHVHGEGAMYYAHGGSWYRALSQDDLYLTANAQSSSYTLATSDLGKMIEMSGGGTLTITDSSSFPVGFSVDVLQTGSSQVTIAGNGFTPNATPGLKLRAQWSSATLIKRALNSWVVLGDLSA